MLSWTLTEGFQLVVTRFGYCYTTKVRGMKRVQLCSWLLPEVYLTDEIKANITKMDATKMLMHVCTCLHLRKSDSKGLQSTESDPPFTYTYGFYFDVSCLVSAKLMSVYSLILLNEVLDWCEWDWKVSNPVISYHRIIMICSCGLAYGPAALPMNLLW